MKIRYIVLAASTALLLTTGNAWAGAFHGNPPPSFSHGKPQDKPTSHKPTVGHHKAPEINAASGTSAIALMTGVLLLVGERVRSRRA
jgi:hypothetical protein